MSDKYKLICLINVFGVKPTFLLPVFSLGENYYFQVIENNIISEFIKADLSPFSACEHIYIESVHDYEKYSNALYALQLSDSRLIIGRSWVIDYFWDKNQSNYVNNSFFIKKMLSFRRATTAFSALPIHSSNHNAIILKGNRVGSIRVKIRVSSLHSVGGYNTWTIGVRRFIENRNTACFLNSHNRIVDGNLLATNNIFQFYDMTIGKSALRDPERIVLYNKKKKCSAYAEVESIFHMINYAPYDCLETRMRRLNFQELLPSSLYIKKSLPAMMNLWNYKTAEQLIYQILQKQDIYPIKRTKNWSTINSWGLSVELPFNRKDIDSNQRNWWRTYLSINESELRDRSKKVYWLEIKTLAKQIYAIVAQDFFSRDPYFRIFEEVVDDILLISFLRNLHNTVNNKITILLIENKNSEKVITHRFTEWLYSNEDIFEIIASPRNLNARQG